MAVIQQWVKRKKHTWSTQGPSTTMDEDNRPPQLAFFLSIRVVYAHMDTIKQGILYLDLIVCDWHQILKTDYGRVDNTDTVTQTHPVSNISLDGNRVRYGWTKLTIPILLVLKYILHVVIFWVSVRAIEKERIVHKDNEQGALHPALGNNLWLCQIGHSSNQKHVSLKQMLLNNNECWMLTSIIATCFISFYVL